MVYKSVGLESDMNPNTRHFILTYSIFIVFFVLPLYSFLYTLIVSCNTTTECSDHGTCGDDGKCVCNDDYYGSDCSSKFSFFVVLLIKYNFENMILLHSVFYSMSQHLFFFHPVACEAATNCNGHGTCRGNGTCECDSHFFGADCTSEL